jgi:hypothetical protein
MRAGRYLGSTEPRDKKKNTVDAPMAATVKLSML